MPKFSTIREAIGVLLETDNPQNRDNVIQLISAAAQEGTLRPHLLALREYIQKHAFDDQDIYKPVVKELLSWLNEAAPVVTVELIRELFLQLRYEKPNVARIIEIFHEVTSYTLANTRIGSSGARALAEVLKNNTTLSSLRIEMGIIRDEGAQYISEALKNNTTLTSLNLDWNHLEDPGANHLAEALKSNSTLTLLNIKNNNTIKDPGIKALEEALKDNFSLTSLLLDSALSDTLNAYLQRNKNCIVENHYLKTDFISDVMDSSPFPRELAELIHSYIIPPDLQWTLLNAILWGTLLLPELAEIVHNYAIPNDLAPESSSSSSSSASSAISSTSSTIASLTQQPVNIARPSTPSSIKDDEKPKNRVTTQPVSDASIVSRIGLLSKPQENLKQQLQLLRTTLHNVVRNHECSELQDSGKVIITFSDADSFDTLLAARDQFTEFFEEQYKNKALDEIPTADISSDPADKNLIIQDISLEGLKEILVVPNTRKATTSEPFASYRSTPAFARSW